MPRSQKLTCKNETLTLFLALPSPLKGAPARREGTTLSIAARRAALSGYVPCATCVRKEDGSLAVARVTIPVELSRFQCRQLVLFSLQEYLVLDGIAR